MIHVAIPDFIPLTDENGSKYEVSRAHSSQNEVLEISRIAQCVLFMCCAGGIPTASDILIYRRVVTFSFIRFLFQSRLIYLPTWLSSVNKEVCTSGVQRAREWFLPRVDALQRPAASARRPQTRVRRLAKTAGLSRQKVDAHRKGSPRAQSPTASLHSSRLVISFYLAFIVVLDKRRRERQQK